MSKVTKACRICVHKDVCRWFPKVPGDFAIRDEKYTGALQIKLEKLFATYCGWYGKKEGVTLD